MEERRKHPRASISHFLRVTEDSTDIVLGYILDISRSGVRLLSDEKLVEGEVRTGRLDLSLIMNFEQRIVFDITPVWNTPGKDGQTEYGCLYSGLDERNLTIIKQLIEQFSD